MIGLGLVALACSFEPGGAEGDQAQSFGGGNTTGSATGDDPQTATSSGVATGATAGTSTSSATSSGPVGTTNEDPSDPTGQLPTSSSETGEESDASSSGGDDSGLQGNVLARYYFDEAPSGTGPERAEDSTVSPFDLRCAYAGGVGQWTEINGNRGLSIQQAGSSAGCTDPIGGEDVGDLDGKMAATYETVLELHATTSSFSRIIHIGQGMDRGDLTLGTDNMGQVELFWEESVRAAAWPIDWASVGRVVIHVVVDLEQMGNQARLYIDGVEVLPSYQDVRPSAAIELGDEAHLGVANRIGDRSIQGVMYYAAIYGDALSPEQVAANAAVLELNDDHP